MIDYRKLYKNHYKINFSNEYHIDFNRENNNIENLLLLPKKLHSKYHEALNAITNNSISYEFKPLSLIENGNQFNSFQLKIFSDFVNVYYECQKWADYKAFLDCKMPNIHLSKRGFNYANI